MAFENLTIETGFILSVVVAFVAVVAVLATFVVMQQSRGAEMDRRVDAVEKDFVRVEGCKTEHETQRHENEQAFRRLERMEIAVESLERLMEPRAGP